MKVLQEVALSNDLTQLTTEIKTYQSIGGQAIFEIGRRLKKVKEEDLAHGQYLKWLESIKMDRSTANKFIKVTQNLPNVETFLHSGVNALYEIATMPEEERDQPQQLDSGEVKKPDEMTVRELRETKKKLKQSEEANKTLDGLLSEKADTISALEQQVKNKPKPEVVEKTVTKEVKPDDYEQLKQQAQTVSSLRNRNSELQNEIDKLNGKLSEMSSKGQEYEELQRKIDNLEKQRSNVRQSIDAGSNIMLLNDQLKELFDTKLSALRYKNFFADDPMTSTVEETEELLDTLQGFIDDMRKVLPQHDRKIIEGKFSE